MSEETTYKVARQTASEKEPWNKPQKIHMQVASDIGLKRKVNQDNFYAMGIANEDCEEHMQAELPMMDENAFVCGVFDGMGGEACGEDASYIAAMDLQQYSDELLDDALDMHEVMDSYSDRVNADIQVMLQERDAVSGGTTASVIVYKEGMVYPYYVGDSRIYLYHNETLLRLTEEHSIAQGWINQKIMTEEEAKTKREWHVITRFFGENYRMISRGQHRIHTGDRLLICSDGLTDLCNDTDIERILRDSHAENSYAKSLVDYALSLGGVDNVTCLVVDFL